jgi:hypothetical protein
MPFRCFLLRVLITGAIQDSTLVAYSSSSLAAMLQGLFKAWVAAMVWLGVGLLVSWQAADRVVAAYGLCRVGKLYLVLIKDEPFGNLPKVTVLMERPDNTARVGKAAGVYDRRPGFPVPFLIWTSLAGLDVAPLDM